MRGRKPRPVYQQAEGKQPESPEYLVREYPLTMHAKEHHDQGVALRLVEGREEVCPTGEQQRSCVIDGVEEVDGRHHQRA